MRTSLKFLRWTSPSHCLRHHSHSTTKPAPPLAAKAMSDVTHMNSSRPSFHSSKIVIYAIRSRGVGPSRSRRIVEKQETLVLNPCDKLSGSLHQVPHTSLRIG